MENWFFHMYILTLTKLMSGKKYKSVPRADLPLQIGPSDNVSIISRFLLTLNTGKCSEKTNIHVLSSILTDTHTSSQKSNKARALLARQTSDQNYCSVPAPVINKFFVSVSQILSSYCQKENPSLFHVTISIMTI